MSADVRRGVKPMRLLWLADALRRGGLTVVEVAGWQSRGSADWTPGGVVVHHTASPRSTPAATDARIITHGHAGLAGPIAQVLLDRTGVVWVIASGRCNHAGVSSLPWGGSGNRNSVGIEASNDGVGEMWPRPQIEAYVTASAVICAELGVSADRVVGHREIALPRGRKIDPRGPWEGGGDWQSFDHFRQLVALRRSSYLRSREVSPMFEPPLRLAPITAQLTPPDGRGVWLLGADGGVYGFGGAAFYGSAAGQPYWTGDPGRRAVALRHRDGGGYLVISQAEELYAFGPGAS